MGLAASQARFLCLTARKANCEYKSTELAQQRLEITNQLSDIANDYAQALNATKLMWSNEGIDGDYGLTYSLLMTPSPMNDFNPYMVTTSTGAIVLNDRYAAAARAAGISKAGGVGSQESRDKFIAELSKQGIVTEATAKKITQYDGAELDPETGLVPASDADKIKWNPAAGMGAAPLNKSGAQTMTLSDLIMSESIGLQSIDWAKIGTSANETTQLEYDRELERINELKGNLNAGVVSNKVISQLERDKSNYEAQMTEYKNNPPAAGATPEEIATYNTNKAECQKDIDRVEKLLLFANNIGNVDSQGYILDDEGNQITGLDGNPVTVNSAITQMKAQINTDYDDYKNTHEKSTKTVDDFYNVSYNDLRYDKNGEKVYSIVMNGVINHASGDIQRMTIGDLLSQQVVLMANAEILEDLDSTESGDKDADIKAFSEAAARILVSISKIFGYSPNENLRGTGLNVDEASEKALAFAYNMVVRNYLRTNNAVTTGSKTNYHSMTDNSAYINATTYNNIGTDDTKGGTYYAVSLSQMVAAFLTYYENGLSGSNSYYTVGKSKDTSIYVTDNTAYTYYVQAASDPISVDVKDADFFDSLYNNILEHGWREDSAIDDNEYLEASLKNGRYSMSSLNNDGYYYQTRYNDTGYMVEVSDTDAIARAEAEFTSKKAELTYKEDTIDIKTKNLDAEIAAINTEVDSVKNIIAKTVEKTFSMFSS